MEGERQTQREREREREGERERETHLQPSAKTMPSGIKTRCGFWKRGK